MSSFEIVEKELITPKEHEYWECEKCQSDFHYSELRQVKGLQGYYVNLCELCKDKFDHLNKEEGGEDE